MSRRRQKELLDPRWSRESSSDSIRVEGTGGVRRPPHTALPPRLRRNEIRTMYEFAPYVSSCITGRRCIFLDLKRDQYFAVTAARVHRLAPLLTDWHPEPLESDLPGAQDESSTDVAEELLKAGLLCNAPPFPTPRPPLPARATRELHQPARSPIAHGRSRHSLPALLAMLRASLALRQTPLWRIADRIRAGKEHPKPDLSDPPPWEVDSITTTFLQIRPWYPRDYLCLYDSLALMLLLGSYRIHADWLFGVREDPFLAHCWVQHKSTVLNDRLDRIRPFIPILAI